MGLNLEMKWLKKGGQTATHRLIERIYMKNEIFTLVLPGDIFGGGENQK